VFLYLPTILHLMFFLLSPPHRNWSRCCFFRIPVYFKDPKFSQNLLHISPLFITGKRFEKVIRKLTQGHLEVDNLLNANQFGFRARHGTTLQCVRLTDHVTLIFNNNTAEVFLDIEKACDTTWYLGLLYKLPKSQLSVNLIKLISSFILQVIQFR
jgi:hypothetical protein